MYSNEPPKKKSFLSDAQRVRLGLSTDPAAAPQYSEDFERWWVTFPRKIDKKGTYPRFTAARGRVGIAVLQEGAERYAAVKLGSDPKYILHPSTWINQERWRDEFDASELQKVQKAERSVDDWIRKRLFPTDPTRARLFIDDVLKLARQLKLIDLASDADLAEVLGDLYLRIGTSRKHLSFEEVYHLGSTKDVLVEYIRWLLDKDWDVSRNVFRFNSPAFNQFRRDSADLDPAHRDPITGSSRE